MINVQNIIIGAGLWGCIIARRLADKGKTVLLIDKRKHIGGNCYCEIDKDTGIEIHSYGCHIFHTSNKKVWNYIRKFTNFNCYQHHNISVYNNKFYYFPIGLNLINSFFNINLKPNEVSRFLKNKKNYNQIFNAFFRGYISKQWNIEPEKLDPNVLKRIAVRNNYDLNYYNDWMQGIPLNGYNKMFENIINHPNIKVKLNTEWKLSDFNKNIPTYYSGPIDELFNYKFGTLQWRSLKFVTKHLNIQDFQGTSVIAYPDINIKYTRIHEDKHFHPENKRIMKMKKTIITYEYSKDWKIGDEPYYPINNIETEQLLNKYKQECKKYPNLIIGGRLGEFRYYDMDQTINSALNVKLL